jgi:mycobactin peptide synthetase MbtE
MWVHGPAASYPSGQSVHGAFLRVARRYPDRPALVTPGGGTLTYAALESAGRRVAAGLADAGVGHGDVVPVLLPRSPTLVAVLLGVLMRGAAYAALDLAWPERRIRAAVDAIGGHTVVARSAVDGRSHWTPPAGLFDEDGLLAEIVPATGESACCVFLTSGSTGAPKPVLSPHRATTRLFAPGAIHGTFGPSCRMPQWAPLPWDAFSLELWSMLLTGGTAVLCAERLPTPGTLRELIADGVDSTWLTSSLFNLIVDEDVAAFGGLRQVWTGGERLSTAHVRRFLDRHPGIRLVNGYGPVESCVFATTHEIRPIDCDDPHGVPLGSPVAGTAVVVLDGDRVCASGEAGEICVAGDGLAIGYLGDERLTALRFVEVDMDGARRRVYRTGDRGAFGEDGLLRFLGRADRQVKLRGFRVELSEVEAHLRAVDAVADAAVLADRDASGSCVGLTGFYVSSGASGVQDPDALRDTLLGSLPPHLVPRRLIPVARVPVTANGKADHVALRGIADATVITRLAPAASTSTAGSTLDGVTAVIGGILGADCSPATRLDRGALTSLQLLRACIQLNERFGISLKPEQVMDAQTVRHLAELVRHERPATAEVDAEPPSPRIALADTQVGFVIEQARRPGGTAGHCLVSWLVRGPFTPWAFEQALTDVQERHEGLRATYHGDIEPYLLIGPGVPARLTQLGVFEDLAGAWAAVQADLLRPLDIGRGELWRATSAEFGPDLRLVGLAVQHVAYDGWSESVLVEDLSVAYAARRAGQRPAFATPVPHLARALADRRAESPSPDAHTFWSQLLGDLPEHRGIRPTARSGPDAVARCSRHLSAAVLDTVDGAAHAIGTTRFPILVAGYARALSRTLGHDDFGIGVPVSVRRHASQERVVTCLVNTVCLRLRPERGGSGSQVALRAQEQMRAASDAYAMPFSEVVRAVNPPRRPGRNPLFRTMFAYQDIDARQLVLQGARISLRGRSSPEPMCELLVEVWPADAGARLDATFFVDAVSAATVEATLDHYLAVLDRADQLD